MQRFCILVVQDHSIEYQKSIHSYIKHNFNPTIKSSLSKLQILIDNEDWNNIPKEKAVKWKTITDSNEIEKVLIQRNIAHLSQAKGTLFTTTPLVKIIGKDGCSPGSDFILNGSFEPPKIY